MRKKELTGIFGCFVLLFFAVVAWAAPVPDTGQSKCYNNNVEIPCPSPGQPFYGQDANYTINPMSYTKLDGSGNALSSSATSWVMVKDNVTGLIWENKTDDGTIHDKDNTYTWYDSNPATNGGNAGTPGDGTDTEDFIRALNSAHFGGYSDWRLPTVKELSTIVNYSIPYPGPTIDTGYFPNTVSSLYWASTTTAYTPTSAWGVYFSYGSDNYYYKGSGYYVRAVRGGQSGVLGDSVIGSFDAVDSGLSNDVSTATGGYTDNGDGTVTDTSTGLTWQKASSSGKTWEQALAYCEGLSLGGNTDWRLPTIKELRSLADHSRYSPAINTTYFPDTVSSFYWASTTVANYTFYAWGVNFGYGTDFDYIKYSSYYVRAVRGGQSGPLGDLVIAQQPMSGPPGTTFVEWGTGFTPNSTATLHFKKPDGTEYPTLQQPMDAIGHFEINYTAPMDKPPGTYTWWAIDGVTGAKSNVVSYTITSLTGGYLVISAISSPQQVNTPFPVTITAKDTSGNTMTGVNGSLCISSQVPVKPTDVKFYGGAWTGEVTLLADGCNLTLFAGINGISGNSAPFSTNCNLTGTIQGVVKDNWYNKLSNATVSLADSTTGIVLDNRQTDQNGEYLFQNVQATNYTFWASKDGKDGTKIPFNVPANQTVPLDLVVPVYESSKNPVILVPGFPASTNIVSGWCYTPRLRKEYGTLADLKLLDVWKFGSWSPGWTILKEYLQKCKGLAREQTIIDCPWDWRRPLDVAVKEYLIPAIERAQHGDSQKKVNIITHSTGALLVRYYIQNYDGWRHIENFSMVGPPNMGVVESYYIWAGGDPILVDNIKPDGSLWPVYFWWNTVEDLWEKTYDKGTLFSHEHGRIRAFIHEKVPSGIQLMPTFDFLNYKGDLRHVGEAGSQGNVNTFLINLNSDSRRFDRMGWPGDGLVNTRVYYSSNESTIQEIPVVMNSDSFWTSSSTLYEDGRPKDDNPKMPMAGDETVLEKSAKLPCDESWAKGFYVSGKHQELIQKHYAKIADDLYKDCVQGYSAITVTDSETATSGFFSISLTGRSQAFLTNPLGYRTGVNPDTGLLVKEIPETEMAGDTSASGFQITNPVDGTYSLRLSSLYDEDFSIDIAYLDNAGQNRRSYRGFIRAGNLTLKIVIDRSNEAIIWLDHSPDSPLQLQANPVDITGQKTRLSWQVVTGAQSYNIYMRNADEPYLKFIGNTTSTSFISSYTWDDSNTIITAVSGITAVAANGNESMLSALITNDDRDHDGLSDELELSIGTDMNNPDTDGDGLLDGDEYIHGTNPTKKDTDGDGYSDYDEVQRGSDPLDPNSVPSTGLSTAISNSIGSRNTIKISDMSGTLPVSGDAITVSAWDANGNAIPESAGATPLKLYNHGTNNISGSVLAARFPSGTPMLYKFAINSSKVVITNVKNSTNDAFKVPIVYLNGVTNFVSNSIGNYNTIKVSDMSGTLPASGSPISVKAWDANGGALTESGSAPSLLLLSHGTISISGSTLAARFPTGSPMIYEFTVQSAKVLITNVKSSTDGKLNVPVAYTSGVSNFVSNSIGSYNTLEISDLSGALPSGACAIIVKAWDANGAALSESGSAAPLTLHNHGTTSISGSTLAARFPAGKPMTYEFSIESAKVLITNVKSSTDGLVEIPSIFTSGISNYATNFVSSLNTIKISDMSGALPASGVAINITAWDTNGTVVLESGSVAPLKLQNLGTTIISGSDLAARFPSGAPKMYEFSIGSSNAIVTSLTTSVDGTIKTPTVFTIGGYGGI